MFPNGMRTNTLTSSSAHLQGHLNSVSISISELQACQQHVYSFTEQLKCGKYWHYY